MAKHAVTASSAVKESGQEVSEVELIRRIRKKLPQDIESRYRVLAEKRDSESLTPSEYAELLALTERIESFEVQRLEALPRLARIRGVPLKALVEALGLQPAANA
jgi:hypothetical protein